MDKPAQNESNTENITFIPTVRALLTQAPTVWNANSYKDALVPDASLQMLHSTMKEVLVIGSCGNRVHFDRSIVVESDA